MSFQLGKTGTPSTNPQPVFGFGQPQQQVTGFSFGQPNQQQQQQQQQQQPTQGFGFTTPASSSSGFTFGSQVTPTPVFGFGAMTTSSGPSFGFGSSLTTTTGTSGGTMFGSTTTASSTPFNFSTPATSSGFTFGAQPTPTSTVPPAFGFGSGSVATTTAQSSIFSTGLTPQAPVGSSFALTTPKSISSPFGVGAPSTFGTATTTTGTVPFNFSFDSAGTTQNTTTTQPFGFGTVVPAVASGTTIFGSTNTTIPSSAPPLQTAPSTTSTFGFPSALTFGIAATTAQNTMGTTAPPQLSSTQAGFGFGLVPQSTQSETKPKSVSFDLPSSSVTSTPVQGSGFIAISTPGAETQPKALGFNLSTTAPTSGVFTAPIATTTVSSTTTSGMISFGTPASIVQSITQTDPKSKALEQTAAASAATTTAIPGFGIGGSGGLPSTTTTTFITPTAITPCPAYTPSTEPASSTAFAPSSIASSNLFAAPAKTVSITSSSTPGFAFTPAATSAGTTTTAASLTTATTVTSSTVTPSPTMNFRQLEEAINKWNLELEEQERIFLNQATEVNAWDRLLVSNGEKITVLSDAVEQVKVNQQKLDHELDFIVAQQRELEEILLPLEKSIESIPNLSVQQHADLEREHTYRLAENIDAQLKRMADDIKEIIEHLNSANSNQDENDPIYQVAKILNAHMDALQWIELNTTLMQRKIDDISKQYGNQKRDQEKPFRTGYR